MAVQGARLAFGAVAPYIVVQLLSYPDPPGFGRHVREQGVLAATKPHDNERPVGHDRVAVSMCKPP